MSEEQPAPGAANPPRLVRLSKWVSLRLRHDPAGIGLALDRQGWAEVDELITASARRGVRFTRADLDAVVAGNNKQRFEYDAAGERIRARQGHSVPVDLGYADTVPPDVLYHGTSVRVLPSIRRAGLLPMSRHDVHLSADVDTASKVGSRHGPPTVLTVDAAGMARDGHTFRVTPNGVWLTAAVPARYLREDAVRTLPA
ncbi:MAG TPA: RNA 2'-phosphotransferase [Actinocrinis sp.]|jgi:putative RNA 2'-phosphotransferase|uniref:RNA 2'-phosphotransferase n=1 Tax=Actinocrinis sp. TaxID=1920516 RepID=UPI002DDCEA74|nr:RNA 2'-phosphotransferase [Actinocrinis sp.]HEV3171762.1 RNA 2'-phosphotransferase [Actinocrinis sp.]